MKTFIVVMITVALCFVIFWIPFTFEVKRHNKEIIYCCHCKYFLWDSELHQRVCTQRTFAYPKTYDYCSKAKLQKEDIAPGFWKQLFEGLRKR